MTSVADEMGPLLDRIPLGGLEATRAIAEIAEVAASWGLSQHAFSTLIEHTFDASLSTTQRIGIIRRCLVPKADYLLDPALINRVIGAVGTPEIYYKNGKQHKLKRMAIGCQQALLEWLICALPVFGRCVFRYLRRCLPLLHTLLLYEFLRPYMVVLIVLAVHDTNTFVAGDRSPIRYWHVKYVADLAERFPFDASLHALLAFFRITNRDRDYSALSAASLLQTPGHLFDIISYPNGEIRRLFEGIGRPQDSLITEQVEQVELHLHRVFSHFQQQSAKRRRAASENLVFEALEAHEAVPIGSIDAVSSLVAHFEEIQITNVSAVLSVAALPNEKFRSMFVALRLLRQGPAEPMAKKLLAAVKYHVLGLASHSALAFSLLLRFGLYGGLRGLQPVLVEFVALDPNPALSLHLLRQIQLLEYITDTTELRACFAAVLRNLEHAFAAAGQERPDELRALASRVFRVTARSIRTWALLHAQQEFPDFATVLADILALVFAFAEATWTRQDLAAQFGFLGIFRALKTVSLAPPDDFSAMVPPPVLTYQLMVSTNAFVVSETLGYIAFLKTVDLSFSPDRVLQLRNSYVVDAINFVWKNAAFKSEEGTLNWGMLLDPRYVDRAAAHNYFSYTNLTQLRTVGGLSHNPALAYMCAELVWQLEDQHAEISTRHPGPLAEELVKLLRQDPEVTWLAMSYDEIRIALLNGLAERGLGGIGDLLFSSLKLLAGKRAS